jgi:hypothetical protein
MKRSDRTSITSSATDIPRPKVCFAGAKGQLGASGLACARDRVSSSGEAALAIEIRRSIVLAVSTYDEKDQMLNSFRFDASPKPYDIVIPIAGSGQSHQHQRCLCLHSPRGRLRYADRLRRPRWRNGQP